MKAKQDVIGIEVWPALVPATLCPNTTPLSRPPSYLTNHRKIYFEAGGGSVWASDLDCLVHMWHTGLMHQVEDFVEFLERQVTVG